MTDKRYCHGSREYVRLTDVLVEVGMAKSKSEGRRLIVQGAIKIQNEVGDMIVYKDINTLIEVNNNG